MLFRSVCLASIATLSTASDAQQGMVEESIEAEVRSSGGRQVSGASIFIPLHCRYLDHDVEIVKEEPSGTFRPSGTVRSNTSSSGYTDFGVTIARDDVSKSERNVVLVVGASKYAATAPSVYLRARLSVRMSCDDAHEGQS